MKTFAIAALAGVSLASNSWGTTGHFGNAYQGNGNKDHSHGDHVYGVDSISSRKDLKDTSTTAYTNNSTRLTAINAQVVLANTARTAYLADVFNRKKQRFQEIHNKNLREINSPFDYQTRLLDKETDDVIVAMTEAINDAADAFTDMIDRLDALYQDKQTIFGQESTLVEAAITRTKFDQKDPCATLRALRVNFLEYVECTPGFAGLGTPPAYNAAMAAQDSHWTIYEGLFDDFHYDIGHGKGHGTGEVDMAPVVDGYGSGSPGNGFAGDSETSYGAPTRTFERPRNQF